MGRINGVNSDYKMIGGAIGKVEPNPANLELKLFLCPYEQHNELEAETGTCAGIDTVCPNPGPKLGHALLHLSQTEGITLKTDGGTTLQLHQNAGPTPGLIAMTPAGGKVRVNGAMELVAGGHTISMTPSATGVALQHTNGAKLDFKVGGAMEIVAGGQSITITQSAAGITLQHTNGSKVVFKPNGNLDLITNNNTGTVNIQGNLVVSGTLSRNGSPV